MTSHSAAVITISTRASQGVYEDISGKVLVGGLENLGFDVQSYKVITDDLALISAEISETLRAGRRLIVTTGGTGISASDVTPEATKPLIEKFLPGFHESLRAFSREKTPKADITRGLAGTSGKSFIVNLPGSQGGVRDGLHIIGILVPHILDQLDGKDHKMETV